MLAYFVKRIREIRKFHVAVVQRRLRNADSFPVAPEAVLTRTRCVKGRPPRDLDIISPQSFVAFEEQISRDWERVCKKRTKKRDSRAQLLLCWYSPIAFFQFSLPSLAIVVIQKFCYHGNVTSAFSFLLMASRTERGGSVHRYLQVPKH